MIHPETDADALLQQPETAAGPQLPMSIEELAARVASRIAPRPGERREILGEVFLECARLEREEPAALARAARRGDLVEWCTQQVGKSLAEQRSETFRGGWAGTYIGADGREIEGELASAPLSGEDLQLSQRAFARAVSMAEAKEDRTLLRNLAWYKARLDHKTYEAIAQSEGRVPATIRTGVARARKFVLKVVHELRHAQPAPLNGQSPEELEPLRELWVAQELAALRRELDRTEPEFGLDPHWLNLKALLLGDGGAREEAQRLYERALVFADAPSVRGRVLNNLGNLADDRGSPEEASGYWLRAHQLLPRAPAPLLNLLAAASERTDYASAQHYTALLGELLSSGHLRPDERSYAIRRLSEHPKLGWLRETEVWRLGPARWIRSESSPRSSLLARTVALCGALLLFVLVPLSSAPGAALEPSGSTAESVLRTGAEQSEGRGKTRGGDSMGSPARRFQGIDVAALAY
jgi:tetratricopeptide (TPR) repeat protein